MTAEVLEPRDAAVESDGAVLSGSLWTPPPTNGARTVPRSLLLMLPGSGLSDRHNDGYFLPLREHLLRSGHAVTSFDKRGAGRSTGSYHDTLIEQQARDAAAWLAALAPEAGADRVGVFGHSQGGWVTYEVAASPGLVDFAIANSAPAVGPAAQERFRLFGEAPEGSLAAAARVFDEMVDLGGAGASFDEVLPTMDAPDVREHLVHYLDGGADWPLFGRMFGYSPESALARIAVPTLVIHGGGDVVIPVVDSLAEFDRISNPKLDLAVLDDGDHRLLLDRADGTRTLVDGYFETIDQFLDRVAP